MSLLPSRVDVTPDPGEPAVVDIADADETFDVLGSRTARTILSTLYEDPRPPTEVRDAVGTSLQNVHYHLDRLESAGLIEPVGTGYSEKGTEMTVYGPASEAVVLFAGRERDRSRLRDLLARVVGAVVVLAAGALAFARLLAWLRPDPATGATALATRDAGGRSAVDGLVADVVAVLSDPAVAFLLGGLLALLLAGGWRYVRRR